MHVDKAVVVSWPVNRYKLISVPEQLVDPESLLESHLVPKSHVTLRVLPSGCKRGRTRSDEPKHSVPINGEILLPARVLSR